MKRSEMSERWNAEREREYGRKKKRRNITSTVQYAAVVCR